MSSRIFVISLGCSKNHCDLENMLGIMTDNGYIISLDEYNADIALINTCGFIEDAKKEAIENILEMSSLKEQGILKGVIVTGCLAQRYKEEILNNFPEVDAVVGVFDFDKIDKIIKDVENGTRKAYVNCDSLSNFNDMPRIQTTPFYTAYLKIAEGCNNRCSYCAIPSIRGNFRSRTMESLIEEATKLATSGVKELIVVAQDTTRYGTDIYKKKSLARLLLELSKIEGISWIRTHYMYPEMIDDELIETIKNNDKLLNYFDIPIQHINDRILKRMNRHTNREETEKVINKIRNKIPDATIRTTVMTGFPGETGKEFKELYNYVKQTKFDRLGAFAFSKEEGTKAFDMSGQLPKFIKERRRNKILKLQQKINEENNKKEIGKIYDVLVEGYHENYGVYFGRTKKDSVDVDGTVMFESDVPVEFGEIKKVKITGAMEYDLTGQIIEDGRE